MATIYCPAPTYPVIIKEDLHWQPFVGFILVTNVKQTDAHNQLSMAAARIADLSEGNVAC